VPGAEVAADPISIRRIVENLFRNALQSLDGTGEVTLSVERVDAGSPEGGMIRLAVIDTGRGMSAETRSRIFDDFFTTRAAGTGLGLSIVRRLVMDLGGSISVESEEGHGSKFMVDLPSYQQQRGGDANGDGDGSDS
jgi:signal transduction histidine kinase